MPLNEDEPLIALAGQAGLDVEQFKKDLDNPDVLAAVAADHEAATTGGERHVRHADVPV